MALLWPHTKLLPPAKVRRVKAAASLVAPGREFTISLVSGGVRAIKANHANCCNARADHCRSFRNRNTKCSTTDPLKGPSRD
jgi:hypothetical protein